MLIFKLKPILPFSSSSSLLFKSFLLSSINFFNFFSSSSISNIFAKIKETESLHSVKDLVTCSNSFIIGNFNLLLLSFMLLILENGVLITTLGKILTLGHSSHSISPLWNCPFSLYKGIWQEPRTNFFSNFWSYAFMLMPILVSYGK